MLQIQFLRAGRGKLRFASCHTETGEFSVSGRYVSGKTRYGDDIYAEGKEGLVYQLIVKLADNGYKGEPFEAHDGRMVCLEGVIDKKSVPLRFGGEKRDEQNR